MMENKYVKQQEPLLSFEFSSSNGEIKPLTFRHPHKVIIAHSIEEVLPSFQLIQESISAGFYAAGFLSYESAPAFDPAFKVNDGHSMPLLWFGIFSEPEPEPQPQVLNSTGEYRLTEWNSSVRKDEYQASIMAIKQAIENGDTYQANYTIRLHSQFYGDDTALFTKLKRAQSSNYCAYINTGEHSILSASPELFFHLKEEQITTRPMKGTVARGKTFDEDQKKANWLYESEKNRAENVMIVDLLRNDVGVIAEPGTVRVPKLFEIEHYPTVHQMTSTITASLKKSTELVDVFKALFPCGSITGAPKISTMDIIANLEKSPREVYCGAIGYITPDHEAIFNVPIRTVMIDHQTGAATYGVGGGITWDSTSEDEYNEVLTKASLLTENIPEFQLLESLLLNEGKWFLKDEHTTRLQNSAKYFGFQFNIDKFEITLDECARNNSHGKLKVRLLLNKNGDITIEAQPITEPTKPLMVTLADQPVDKNHPFLYHKTTNRDIYAQFQKKFTDVYDVLLWNEAGEITEFTNGNIVLEIDEQLWTPTLESGLLAGTYREMLLATGKIYEKVLTIDDVRKSHKIWFINSVREWVEVQFV